VNEPSATSLLVTNLIQAGCGVVSLAMLVFVVSPRLRRMSARVRRLERKILGDEQEVTR